MIFLVALYTYAGMQQQGDISSAGSNAKVLTIGVYGELENACRAVFTSEDFKIKFPALAIELKPADKESHHNRLVTQIASGTGTYDIEALDIGYIARLLAADGLTDLAPAPYNGNEAGKNLVKYGMANAATKDGILAALPVNTAPAVLFWRESKAQEAGINLNNPGSWQEYIEKGTKLTIDTDGDGKKDQYALTHPAVLAMIPLNGGYGDWFQGNEPYAPKQRFTDVLTLVQAVRKAGIDANLAPSSDEWMKSFSENRVVTMFSGSWLGNDFRNWMCPELKGDWRISYPPARTYASYGGTYLSIPKATAEEKKADCWAVIKYLCTSPEAQLLSFRTTRAFPALTTVLSNPVMNEPVEYFGGQVIYKIFQDIVLNIPRQKVSEYDDMAVTIFRKAINAVISDNVSVEQAYNAAKKELLSQL